jgi:DNA-binding transcriptional LysR family regulator
MHHFTSKKNSDKMQDIISLQGTIMDRLHSMQVFAVVAETTGFAAASRQLNMSPPAVTRAVAALEDQLGVKLLQRTTRQVKLTEIGARYLEDCRRILAEIQAADEAVTGMVGTLRGRLAITAPVLFGRYHVMPIVTEFLTDFPDMEVDLLLLDRVVSLLEEGLDVAVRIGALDNLSLHARQVGQVRLLTLAAPDYLKEKGTPQQPIDLHEHQLINTRGLGNQSVWTFSQAQRPKPIRVQARLSLNTNDAAQEAAKSGFGIVRLISYQVQEALAKGQLVPILTDVEPPPLPVHIVHRGGRFTTTKVRAFIDFAAERLRHRDLGG